MAKINIELKLTKYMIVFFPIATYSKAGDMSMLTVFGIRVYERVGNLKRFMWHWWEEKAKDGTTK